MATTEMILAENPAPSPDSVAALDMPAAPTDHWFWELTLDDGSTYAEYEYAIDHETRTITFTSEARSIAGVEKDRIIRIVLVSLREGFPHHAAEITPGSGARLDFYRRRALESNLETGDPAAFRTIRFIEMIQPGGACTCTFFFDDGSVFVSDDRNAVNP